MTRLAAGTTDIVATPHANNRYVHDEVAIERKLAELRTLPSIPCRIWR
jgi:tyrosine-protein phosphatase YwqE